MLFGKTESIIFYKNFTFAIQYFLCQFMLEVTIVSFLLTRHSGVKALDATN